MDRVRLVNKNDGKIYVLATVGLQLHNLCMDTYRLATEREHGLNQYATTLPEREFHGLSTVNL